VFIWHVNADCPIDKISEKHRISLARNRANIAYTETNSDKIELAIKGWPEVTSNSESTSCKFFIKHALALLGDRRLITILEDPSFHDLLLTQHAMPITWVVTPQWSVTWL
jgi:hypothetical protein